MNNLKTLLLAGFLLLAGMGVYAQGKVTGKVIDGDTNEPLPGANVVLKGTNYGTATDFDGKFIIEAPAGNYVLLVSYVGYEDKTLPVTIQNGKTTNVGLIKLKPSAESLGEVVIVGVADIAKERETPVAQTTLRAVEIQENIGTKELPEVLNYTPSVYATKRGGGWGDARINVRGFDQRNTAVLINGMPVNDMENGWVYWSNWAGLADVVSAMQVQRGLGASKLAISSVGGTINILTTTSEKKKGGSIGFSVGNDGYMKWLASYSTGLLDNGFSASFLLSHTKGDGYVDATQFNGYTWFIGLGYKPSDKLSFMFTATGAPQWHHQRDWAPEINDYIKYGGTPEVPNIKYNSDWGFLDGEVFSWRRNFYHKPIASLNIDYIINDNSKINSVFYGSWGRGGGTGGIGKINGAKYYYGKFRDQETGLVRFDDIYTWNSGGEVPDFGDPREPDQDNKYTNVYDKVNYSRPYEEGISRRASMNSHDWYGSIINYHNDFSDNLSFDLGVDWRTYKGYHYRVLNHLLGADRFLSVSDVNNPQGTYIYEEDLVEAVPSWNPFINITDQKKIVYYNVGKVKWLGGFTQVEYKNETLSTFVQAGFSNQGFKRIDYFNLPVGEQESDWVNLKGGNIKTGVNYNINEHNNVFVNAGYYSKQPLFRAVFPNYNNNDITPDLRNEKIKAVEAGYGYKDDVWKVKLNLYWTSWKDRFAQISDKIDHDNNPDTPPVRAYARLYGINEIHKGIELESTGNFGKLKLYGTVSVGDWRYKGNVTAPFVDENNNPLNATKTLYLDNVKVGDAAQFTSRLGIKYYILENLSVNINQFYADNLYARFDVTKFSDPDKKNQALKLPAYSLVDAGINYNVKVKDYGKLYFGFHVDNIFDKIYISESATNYFPGEKNNRLTWKGINTKNRVFFGWGRTWKMSVKFRF